VVGLVTLEDAKVNVLSNIINCVPESVTVGMPVRVVYDDVSPDFTLFKFASEALT
jgi:uncharacterized OB-fold protein